MISLLFASTRLAMIYQDFMLPHHCLLYPRSYLMFGPKGFLARLVLHKLHIPRRSCPDCLPHPDDLQANPQLLFQLLA